MFFPSEESGSIRVAAFTGGQNISSRRFRVQQYVSPLRQTGIDLTEFLAPLGSWPPVQKLIRPLWLPATIASRVPDVLRSHAFDVVLLQREMVSTLLTLERFTRRPRILDVDDAVWLNPRADKNFPALTRICDGVICGNEFIAENVANWNQNVIVLPTAVDTDRFRPLPCAFESGTRPVIGWSGLNAGFKYLRAIEPALREILARCSHAVLRIVSDLRPEFRELDEARIEFIPWSPRVEVRTMQEMTVGLMPIDDTPWSRGKCSYKMLLYMACGIPVVVSPFGMNLEVLARGDVGLCAKTPNEWVNAVICLLENPNLRRAMGKKGRQIVEEHYSLHSAVPIMSSFIKSFVA